MLSRSIELTVTLAFLFSVMLLTLSLSSAGLHSSHMSYYEMYGQSLAKGHLWVEEAANPEQCAYDLSFYKGRCYLYWGIFPAVVHWILPFISDRAVTLIACSIALFFLLKILRTLTFGDRREGMESAAMPFYLFTAFGTSLPALCIAARIYEEAIAVAYACGFAGLYFAIPLLLGEEDAAPGSLRPLASSLCLVLAGLCRLPWMIPAILLNLWLFIRPAFARQSLPWRMTLPAIVPVILAGSLQLDLNYQRFEDLFDFGFSKGTYNAGVIASGKKVTGIEYFVSPANSLPRGPGTSSLFWINWSG